jgi:3',5'-cyclic AMP phosphodiesterase CpdA
LVFTLAQIGDPHIAPLPRPAAGELLSKRLLGYLSWSVRRKHVHTPEVLAALSADVVRARPDHIAVVGDLTNIALAAEFPLALAWLRTLGEPRDVSVVPGNHDAYVSLPFASTVGAWDGYVCGDAVHEGTSGATNGTRFPWLRARDNVAIVGVSTAIATAPFLATGTIGGQQLERLRAMLRELGERRLFRAIVIHHPPLDALTKWRKRLTDSAELAEVIADTGAELILHGHTHKATVAWMRGHLGSVPVVATTSASANGSDEHELRSRYNLFHIERDGAAWRIDLEVRALGPDGRFVALGRGELAEGGPAVGAAP